MGYFEAAVVVYLRQLIYPDGFSLPLRDIPDDILYVELFREVSTIIMLAVVAHISGRKFQERFGWFIVMFGVWDIFYYIWLNVSIGWPSTLFDWDILFLIPCPWIGPVLAPVLIALLMIIFGALINFRFAGGGNFKPAPISWILSITATGLILYSFMHDTDATLRFQEPMPYIYWLYFAGIAMYCIAFLLAYFRQSGESY